MIELLDKLGRHNKGWTKAGPGRNKKLNKPHALQALIEKETMNELKIKAKKEKTSVSELVRTYIEWGLENEK